MLENTITRPTDDARFLNFGFIDILGWVTLFLLWAVLCSGGWLAASSACTHKTPVATPKLAATTQCLQTCQVSPWGTARAENHWVMLVVCHGSIRSVLRGASV